MEGDGTQLTEVQRIRLELLVLSLNLRALAERLARL